MATPPVEPHPVVLRYPLEGTFRVRNSPARRVPSHGTHLMGTTYAIDLVPVDSRGRSAPPRWRAVVFIERPEAFVGFGARVPAPAAGVVVVAHDGEPDHEARRSQLALVGYLAGQAGRLRQGPAAIGRCGNSGNSTEPHVHVQVTDSLDWPRARGLPLAFTTPTGVELPAESQVITAPLLP